MDKIIQSYNSIDKFLNQQKIITIVLGSLSIIGIIIMSFLLFKMSNKDMYAIDNQGDIVSISKISRSQVFAIESDNHVRLFYSRFFSYDKSNYTKRVEMGLYLGGKSVKNLFETYQSKGWYNSIVNNDIIIESYVPDNGLKINVVSNNVSQFIAKGIQVIKRDHFTEKRHLEIKGMIYAHPDGRQKIRNPHGLIIDDIVILNNNIIQDEQ